MLKLLEGAKTKVRDPRKIEMVEAAYVKLKGHLWYLSERLVPPPLFSARAANRDKKETANVILRYENQACPDCQQMPETKDFGAKLLKHLVGPDSGIFFELLYEKKLAFLQRELKSSQLKNHTCR